MLTRRAARRSNKTAKKLDAKKVLLDLGFKETEGAKHTEYTLYDADTGRKIAYTSIGRGSETPDLRPGELALLKKVLIDLGRKDLYNKLIGATQKKKEKRIIKEVPFFSAWANGVEKDLTRLSYDKSITNKEEALYDLYVEDALVDDATLDSKSFREELKHLVRLISNNENYHISKISTADILYGIMMVNTYRDNVSAKDILEEMGTPLGLEPDVDRHIKKLQDKGWVAAGDDIVLTEEGIEASASSTFHNKLLKLSQWMMSSGFKKEAALVLRLTRS